jgi:hypothetical protein
MSAGVHSYEIVTALNKRYERDSCGFFSEVPTGHDVNGDLRLDGVNLQRSGQDLHVQGFEVKISRSDFLRDNKYHLYGQYVNALTLVCPSGMIQREEVPEHTGLMWYTPSSRSLRYRRKPTWDMSADTQAVRNSILTRLAWHDTGSRYLEHYETAQQYLDEKADWKNVGHYLGTKMAKRIEQLEYQKAGSKNEEERIKAERYDKLIRILRKHGYTVYDLLIHDINDYHNLDQELDQTIPFDGVDLEIDTIINAINRILRGNNQPIYTKEENKS